MKDLTIFLEELMDKTQFPEESKDTFRALNKKLLSSEHKDEFDDIDKCCTEQKFEDIHTHLDRLTELSEKVGVHYYTMHLFYHMYAADNLKKAYIENNISLDIFWDTVRDLRAKLVECHDVYGIWGSFVASWFRGFYNLSRFALGRLQFEQCDYGQDEPYVFGDYVVNHGDPVIGMHIPSLGRLPIESVYDAFERAYKFYPDFVRDDGIIVFGCGSWLLYKENKDFYPKDSNLMKFIECFDIVESHDSESFGDAWRVFGKYKDAPYNELPTDTTLRRVYAERLMSGKPTGGGFGVILFDGKKIVNKR